MPASSRPRLRVTGPAARRLSRSCHSLHVVLVVFVLAGWLIPVTGVLAAHLVFVPALVAMWRLNDNTCVLNNIETVLTKGTWRDPDNREEGSFLLVIVEKYLRLQPSQRQMDNITYALMATAWLLSLAHWWLRTQAS